MNRKLQKHVDKLTAAHWALLESLATEVLEGEEDVMQIPDDAGKGLARTLARLEYVELVEEPGRRAGYTITDAGLAALNEHAPRGEE